MGEFTEKLKKIFPLNWGIFYCPNYFTVILHKLLVEVLIILFLVRFLGKGIVVPPPRAGTRNGENNTMQNANFASEIKAALPMEKVLQSYGAIKKAKNQYFCLLHEQGGKSAGHKTASLVIHPDSQTITCMSQGCFQGEDAFGVIAKMEGLDVKTEFPKVLEAAAAMAGMAFEQTPKPVASPTLLRGITALTAEHKKYLLKRGLTEETIGRADFRSMFDKIVFPYKYGGEIIGFKAKTILPKDQWVEYSKLNSKWTDMFQKGAKKPSTWSIDELRGKKIIYVVAGEYDACILSQGIKATGNEAGIGVLTLTTGEGSGFKEPTLKQFKWLDNTEWRIVYDYDKTGLDNMPKRAAELMATGKKVYTFVWKPEYNPNDKKGFDINDYYLEHGDIGLFLDPANFQEAEVISPTNESGVFDAATKTYTFKRDNLVWKFSLQGFSIMDESGKLRYSTKCHPSSIQTKKFRESMAADLSDAEIYRTKQLARKVLLSIIPELIELGYGKNTAKVEEPMELLERGVTLDEVWAAVCKIGVTTRELLEILMATTISVAFDFPVPIWLLLIGNPSSLKTELIKLFRGVKDRIYYLSTMTENAFASGYIPLDGSEPKDLLPELEGKILLVRDLTTLFSLNEETVKKLLGDLTSIFDGEFDKFTATRGHISYPSKFPFLACITPLILSRHNNYVNQLGPRFLFFRIPPLNEKQLEQGFAIAWSKENRKANLELAATLVSSYCAQIIKRVEQGFQPEINHPDVIEWLSNAAEFVRRARGIVISRAATFKGDDGKDHTYYEKSEQQSEEPWRALNQLRNLAICLAAIRGKKSVTMEECQTLGAIIQSTAPPDRAIVIQALVNKAYVSTKDITKIIGQTYRTAQRQLEELRMLEVVVRFKDPGYLSEATAPNVYSLQPEFHDLFKTASVVETPLVDNEIPSELQQPGLPFAAKGQYSELTSKEAASESSTKNPEKSEEDADLVEGIPLTLPLDIKSEGRG